jgi:multicomponent K+:H+ antiporter subunit D
MRYMEATAQVLYWPSVYANDVLGPATGGPR